MKRQSNNKTAIGGWLFLLLVLVAYAVLAGVDMALVSRALGFFAKIIGTVLPVLALVFILLLAADLLLNRKWVERNLGRGSGPRGWLMAALAGVLSTGPIYPWYALLRELRGKGMRTSLVAVFLYGRAIKLPLLPLMVHYFGTAYTLVLCLYLFLFSIVSGMLTGLVDRPERA
jgi:uncharacterized membrane protein YraQ (UPF0718 family)